jgi:hypothetical protein
MLLSDGTGEHTTLWRRLLRKTLCVRLVTKIRDFRSKGILSSA